MKFHPRILMNDAGDGKGGGGGANPPAPGGDALKELTALKESNAALLAKYEALEKKLGANGEPKGDDDDLRSRALKTKTDDEKKKSDTKAIENAVRFSLNSAEFLKQNRAILPKEVESIFAQAEKDNYDNPIEKDAAIKAGILESFFSVQANLDLLTPGLKTNLEEYLSLTKSGKQAKAQEIYNAIFEPAFEMLKREKRAQALQKGFGNPGGTEDAYKNRLIESSKKHYLKEKHGT